jgi:hypothetical protein
MECDLSLVWDARLIIMFRRASGYDTIRPTYGDLTSSPETNDRVGVRLCLPIVPTLMLIPLTSFPWTRLLVSGDDVGR